MKTLVHTLAFFVAFAASGACRFGQAAASPIDPCTSLAARARSLPAAAWRQGVEKAMAPALFIDKERNPDAPNASGPALERSLTRLPWVRIAVNDEPGNWSEFVSRLPGRDIYMVSTYQGTLHCQSATFVKATAGSEPTEVPAPRTFGEGEGPCWTQSGKLGAVDGQPVFIEGGADSDHVFDASYDVVPWADGRWVQGCRISLRFRTSFDVAARHCGDTKVCRAADSVVVKLAAAYAGFRQSFDKRGGQPFTFGPPEKALTARQRLIEGQGSAADIPEFPRFGDKDETYSGGSFSYSGFQFTPLRLAGRWYVAAIGHEGVGWRETNRTLIAVYTETDGVLTPKASFEVQAVNAGLSAASARPDT